MKIYFIRHAEPDYSFLSENDNYSLANFAGLSTKGIDQALNLKEFLKKLNLKNYVILSSPYTRALQTASIATNDSDIIRVEFDLHEWFPSKNMDIEVNEFKNRNYLFINKEYGDDIETPDEMKERLNRIIEKYKKLEYENLVIFAHSRLIKSYLGCKSLQYCEVKEVII